MKPKTPLANKRELLLLALFAVLVLLMGVR